MWNNGIVRDIQRTMLLCLGIDIFVDAPRQSNEAVLVMYKLDEDESHDVISISITMHFCATPSVGRICYADNLQERECAVWK